MLYNEFENEKFSVASGDLETLTFTNGKLLSDEQMRKFYSQFLSNGEIEHNISYAREHTEVKAWAWLIGYEEKFAICETFEEYMLFCEMHEVKQLWFYNSKFDFAFFDYQLLTKNFQKVLNQKELKDSANTYLSLHNEYGQRYKLSINYNGYCVDMVDFMNYFQGGLAKCLHDFNIKYESGEKISKLTMEYNTEELTEDRIKYMKVDVIGLFKLVKVANEFIKENFSVNLCDLKKLTAGSLAKNELLKNLYPEIMEFRRNQQFRKKHIVSPEEDEFFRQNYLYCGGKTFANSIYKNKLLKADIYYYDRNSMYPSEMAIMPDLQGKIYEISVDEYLSYFRDKKDYYTCIIEISNFHFYRKIGCLEILYNPFIKEYVSEFDSEGRKLLYFDFEFEQILEFYDINENYEISRVWVVKNKWKESEVGDSYYFDFINKWYELKNKSKFENNKVMNKFAKLILNSSYGKLAQNPIQFKSERVLKNGIVSLQIEKDEENARIFEVNENVQMSIIQGAYITAKARCNLMQTMILASGGVEYTKKNIIYCDTDSIQSLKKLPSSVVGDELGQWKLETGEKFNFGKWLAPKTYILGKIKDDKIDCEVHTKGVNVEVVKQAIEGKTIEQIDKIFANNRKFQCLQGINVKGGKALIPLVKSLNNAKINDIEMEGEQ